MGYTKQNWENLPSTNTPITAERLNHMEDGIEEAWEHGGGGAGETLPVGSEIDFDGQESEIPTGWEQISDKAKILWTNPNPTSDFASSQDIILSSDDYDVLEFYFRSDVSGNRTEVVKLLKGYSCQISMFSASIATRRWNRKLVYSSNTKYISENAYQLEQGQTTTAHNEYCVPLYVIGYKTGLF